MTGTVDDPSAEVRDDLFRLFALHAQFSRGGRVELGKHLNAQGPGSVFEQAREQRDGLLVFEAGSAVVGIDQDVGVDELNAHATLPGSSHCALRSPWEARCGFSRENGAWLRPHVRPGPSGPGWPPS